MLEGDDRKGGLRLWISVTDSAMHAGRVIDADVLLAADLQVASQVRTTACALEEQGGG